MASIRERNGAYKITVSCGYTEKGKKLTKSMTYHPTATGKKEIDRELQRVALDFEEKVKTGRFLDGDHMTFTEFVPIWKDAWAKQQLTQSVMEDYEYHLGREIGKAIGYMKIGKIKPIHLQTMINNLTADGKSPKTVRYIFVITNSVMRFAYQMEIVEENPCLRCSLPKVRSGNDMKFFEAWQANAFLKALREGLVVHVSEADTVSDTGRVGRHAAYTVPYKVPLKFQVYFHLAIYGGFRRGELVALSWDCIDFSKKTVTICKSAARVAGGQIIKEPKTESAYRTVRLPDICFDLLLLHKNEQLNLIKDMGTEWKGPKGKKLNQNLVVSTDQGKMINLNIPGKKFKKYVELYNDDCNSEDEKLPIIRLHDLRHTSATLMIASGVDIETVSHRMGHSKPSITMDIYGHPTKSNDDKASELLEAALRDSG